MNLESDSEPYEAILSPAIRVKEVTYASDGARACENATRASRRAGAAAEGRRAADQGRVLRRLSHRFARRRRRAARSEAAAHSRTSDRGNDRIGQPRRRAVARMDLRV